MTAKSWGSPEIKMLMWRFTRRSGSKGEGVEEKKKKKKKKKAARESSRQDTHLGTCRATQHSHTDLQYMHIRGWWKHPARRISGGVIVCDDTARRCFEFFSKIRRNKNWCETSDERDTPDDGTRFWQAHLLFFIWYSPRCPDCGRRNYVSTCRLKCLHPATRGVCPVPRSPLFI